MSDESWEKAKWIFGGAMKLAPVERRCFLEEVCAGDTETRREVESLLASFDGAENFMENPAACEVAELIVEKNSRFASGEKLSRYEIIKQIGAGGMGEVYLAKDSELDRLIALKVLSGGVSRDAEHLRRFVREAKSASALNHPNILTIYEIGTTDEARFIASEFVKGETLRDRLKREPPDLTDALDIAMQIASALEAAHEAKIVHRDIKPENVMVREDGLVKVLDFGLAKLVEPQIYDKEFASTRSQVKTRRGIILGTAAYMSPEQARGKAVDTRNDIWSLGVVLYEMLAGFQPFAGETISDAIASILKTEPAPLAENLPTELNRIVGRSLRKNADERYKSAKELLTDLRRLKRRLDIDSEIERVTAPPKFTETGFSTVDATDETNVVSSADVSRKIAANLPGRFGIFFAAVILLIGAAMWLAWQTKKNGDSHSFDSLRPVKLVSWKPAASSIYSDYSASHSGKLIAYSSTQDGKSEGIFVKQTGEGEDLRVTRDEWRNFSPLWSPDDRQIAFASVRDGQAGIYLCPSLGGTSALLKTIGDGSLSLQHWSKDGAAIFYEFDGNLYRLDTATKETAQLTNFAPSRGDSRDFSLSPDEERIAYIDKTDGQTDVWMMPLKGGAPFRLTNDAAKELRPIWHADGERILYTAFRDNHYQINLAFADGREPAQITRGDSEYELIDISKDGTKIFYLTWEDKSDIWAVKIESGEEFEVTSAPESEFWADVSPDGKSIAYQSNPMPYVPPFLSKSAIVVKSLGDAPIKISFGGYNQRWLPDSRRIAFLRWQDAEQKYNLWIADTVSGNEKQLTTGGVAPTGFSLLPYNRAQTGEYSWSPDGGRFVYLDSRKKDVWLASPGSAETINLSNNDNPKMNYDCPLWSPDGKRIAYVSMLKPTSSDEKSVWSVWLAEQGKPKEIYSTNASLRFLGWSNSGGELLFEMTDGAMKSSPIDIQILQLKVAGDGKIVASFKNIYAASMALSADGKTLAFTLRRDDKDNIWTASATGGEARKITANADPKLFFGSLVWSPDGKTIFFDKQEELNTISMFENFK